MTNPENDRQQAWEQGWDGHRKAQLLRMAKSSFAEKLKWLDDAQAALNHFSRQVEKRDIHKRP